MHVHYECNECSMSSGQTQTPTAIISHRAQQDGKPEMTSAPPDEEGSSVFESGEEMVGR